MSSSVNEPRTASGDSSPVLSEASSATEPQSNNATKGEGPLNQPASERAGEADEDDDVDDKKTTGWLVTSCDVGTAEPRSLSQELERLQVLKSYHIMDPERDEAFDRLTRMASRILGTPYTFLSLVDMGRIWFRSNPDSDCEQQLTRDILSALARVIMKHDAVFDIPDINLDDMFRQGGGESSSNSNSNSDSSTTQFRFFAGAPLMSPEGYRLGAVCMLGTEPRPEGITEMERENLKDFADLAVKTMVDRRKLTTQGSPSHLVACTAHDLITPLTGIQLSLSLLQQDGDFQAKLGDKRKEHISAAVRSSNMMLRICQSTIETLRGNRKIPAGTDWSLPRNLMQIAEASPFIDMKEFTANLEAISNSIPKRVPLKIILHPSAPINIVSDGLKIFRSALNLLSNACSRANSGSIVMTIFDDEDGSLVFECEDNGKEIEMRDSQSLFNQDNNIGNFGLYSVAYQINWLGGKYGVRKRAQELAMVDPSSSKGDRQATARGTKGEDGGRDANTEDINNKKFTIFWFSIPIVLPQDVSELMGLAKSLSDTNEEASIPTFKADLPVTPPASPQIEESQEKQSPSIPKGIVKKAETTRTLNALIIEDSTTVRKILGRALSKLGYQVFEAVDGMEGLRELKTTMFDMVLCDFLMPVMDGLDCVKQYREWEVTNRQVFRQYIVGISAHASRNDIERGLKLGMDDFKPKPIVLKTLTGLHESDALKAVRASLDNLLNLPSLEVKRRRLSGATYTIPAAREMDDYGDDKTPLFAIPGPRHRSERSEDDKKEDDGPSLFAVPRRPSQLEKDKPPLFSIPPELTESGRRSPKGKTSSSPLFSIPTKQIESSQKTLKGASNAAPLFPIPSSKSESGPLFSISKPNESGQPQAAGSGSSHLFSISTGKKDASQQSSQRGTSTSPLFSIPTSNLSGQTATIEGPRSSPLFSISAKGRDSGEKSPAKPALFSISVNPTEPPESEVKKRPALFALPNTKDGAVPMAKKPALFSIAINTTTPEPPGGNRVSHSLTSIPKASEETNKPAALFSLSANAKSPKSDQRAQTESQKSPLFSLSPNPTKSGEEAHKESKKAPLFSLAPSSAKSKQEPQKESKKPPLFSLASNTTELDKQKEIRKPPLFSMVTNSTKLEEQKESKQGPLFSLPKKASEMDGQSPTKAKKPALFSISVNPTAPGGKSKKPSLFEISDLKNGTDGERSSKRPALFALSGKASKPAKEAKGNEDNGSELSDSNNRPKKAMKRALFDIATRSDEK